MKKSITSLAKAEQAVGVYLVSPGATAVRTAEEWVYVPPRKRLRRRQSVTFPHPQTISDASVAERWAQLAEDVVAETKIDLTAALAVLAFLLSLSVLPLNVGLAIMLSGPADPSRQWGAQLVATAVAALAVVGMLFFTRGPRQAPVWERRAVALRARAVELAPAPAAAGEMAGQCRRWHWPWPRGHRG